MKNLIWILIIINFGCTPIFNYKDSSCADEKLIRISKVAEFAKKNKKQPYDILTEEENSYYINNIQNCPDLYDHYAKLRKNKLKLAKQNKERKQKENNSTYESDPELSRESKQVLSSILSDLEKSVRNSNSSSTIKFDSGQPKGCHIFGKIKFVQFGGDYKIRMVGMSPNLKVKYVSYGASTQGNWQIVDFGEDYKIELVQAGEDFSVQIVDFGQGCN